jgi:LmbE family N-acetylglucosaminyl deacetylase
MGTKNLSRRSFIKQSIAATGPTLLAAGTLPGLAAEPGKGDDESKRHKIVCVGGHPDDPESGCAGTLARYVESGHAVTVIYLTRGERGIEGKSNDEAARIRSAECEAACKIIGAKAAFAGQIDGSADFTRGHVETLRQLLAGEKPTVVFTHWPIDTHMDHQVASLCSLRACMALQRRPQLYFFEVNSGSQTQGFTPNTYVDVTSVLEKKGKALFAHQSQDGASVWRTHHEPIAIWRGREAGVKFAEAFVRLNRDNQNMKLPGL